LRVVIDDKIVTDLSPSDQQSKLGRDDDGKYYIDYFKEIGREGYNKNFVGDGRIGRKEYIESLLRELEKEIVSNKDVVEKLEYLKKKIDANTCHPSEGRDLQ
jgi:hypothetical protein